MTGRAMQVETSDTGCWEAVKATPSAAIRRFMHGHYVGWTEVAGASVERREVPQAFVPVIINFAAPFSLTNVDGRIDSLSSFAAGAHDSYTLVQAAGATCCLQFNLSYDGALRLFGLSMHDVANRTIGLDDLLGRDGRQLVEQLGNAAGWSERFDLLDGFLERRLPESRGVSQAVAHVLEHVWDDAPIGALAEDLGISRKRLICEFHRDVGLGPKTIRQVHRFAGAVALLRRRRDLAAIALDCGYYDQAHFNRDFRRFAGIPPLQFMGQRTV